jgi:carbamoyl-phosphate synthase large subunit
MELHMDNLTVLFTGAGSSMGQSVMKAFLESRYSGARIVVTNSEPGGAGFFLSDKVSARHIVPLAKDRGYAAAIEGISLREGVNVIFSGTEHEIFVLSGLKERFCEQHKIHIALSEPRVIEIGTDKLRTAEFFAEHRLPFPDTALFSDYKRFAGRAGYPMFMKPRVSSASRNIFVINSEEELLARQFAAPDEIILQSYLDSDVEYTVEVFVDRDGKVAGTIPMRRKLEHGLSVSGSIDRNAEVIELCNRIALALKPQGALNVQLRVVDGKPIPFELNTRFSSTEVVRARFGYNAVEAYIDNFVFGKDIDLSNYGTGHFFRYWEESYCTDSDYRELCAKGALRKT